MLNIKELFNKKFYIPNFKNRNETVYEISRIFFSIIAGITFYIESYILYLRANPLLGVRYVGEVVFFILGFSMLYYFIPYIIRAVGDSIKNLLSQSINEIITNMNALSESRKASREPKIQFNKTRPVLLDTSSIIDGRVLEVIKQGFIDSQIIVPQFVIDELQLIADNSIKEKRKRGRRGLDILNQIKEYRKNEFKVYPTKPVENVDYSLLKLAKKINARVATTDYNLNKVAKIKNITILNINALSKALKPSFLPGDVINLTVHKVGESAEQGVGYLDDGTMVVVSNGAKFVNKKVLCTVTKVLQTDAGQLIFTDITTSFLQASSSTQSSKNSHISVKSKNKKG